MRLRLPSWLIGSACMIAIGMGGHTAFATPTSPTGPAHTSPTVAPGPAPPRSSGGALPAGASVSEADLKHAMDELDSARMGLQVLEVILVALSLFVGLAGLIGFTYLKNVIQEWGRQGARHEFNALLARVYLSLAFVEWARERGRKQGLTYAIQYGEAALEAARAAGDEERTTVAESNLAYFYAEEGLAERREIALEYAKRSRENFVKFPQTRSLLANNIYVRTKYAAECDVSALAPLQKDAEALMQRFPELAEELAKCDQHFLQLLLGH